MGTGGRGALRRLGLGLAAGGVGVAVAVAPVVGPAAALDGAGAVKAGDFACGAWGTASDSALTYAVGPDLYPVGGWELLPGWAQGGLSSYPCVSAHAGTVRQTIPLTGPDGTVLATLTVEAASVDTSIPDVRTPGDLSPLVGDGGDAVAHPVTVRVQADGVDIVVDGLWSAASARCTAIGQLPNFSTAGGAGRVTVNGVPRTVGSAPLRVGPVGLRFNDVRQWGDDQWGGISRYALTVDLYPQAGVRLDAGGSLGTIGGGGSVDAYSRTYVGYASVVRFGNPCAAL